MNQNTRQRITGTIVLAIAALILLPVIFDGEGSYQAPLQTDIPARPAQPDVSRSLPQRPVITADTDAIRIRPESSEPIPSPATPEPEQTTDAAEAPATAQSAAPSTSTPTSTPASTAAPQSPAAPAQTTSTAATPPAQPDGPVLDPRGLPEAWSVRLGSFSNTDNANNLVARLQQAGHRAYTRRVNSSQGVLTAVFVGPLVDRATAQSLMERLRQDFQLNGLIVRYEIEEL